MKEGRKPGVEELHELLRELGIFTDGYGPHDGCPVQIWGVLKTGEFVYFHAGGIGARSQIYAEIRQAKSAVADDLDNHDGELIVRYDLPVESHAEATEVPAEIRRTLDRCPEPGQPYRTASTLGAGPMNHDTAALILRRWLRQYLGSKK